MWEPVMMTQEEMGSQYVGEEIVARHVQNNGEDTDPAVVTVSAERGPRSSRRSVGTRAHHRPVHQRWYYEPISSVPANAPMRSKRESKQPQRLTSSRLGGLSSSQQPTALLSKVFGPLTNEESFSSSPSRSDKVVLFAPTIFDASPNQDPEFVEICGLCSDKTDAAGFLGAHESSMDNAAALPAESESPSDLSTSSSSVPLVPPAPPREGFSVGDGNRTGRFIIRLTFPGSDLPDQTLEVTSSMTVPTLQRCLADLMGNRHGVSMFVAPSWDQLDHGGLITALYIPGTATPCPALAPGSLVRVLPWEPFHEEPTQGSSSVRSSWETDLMRGPKRSREEDGVSESGSDTSSPPPLRLFPQAPAQISDDDVASDDGDVPPVVTRRVLRSERAILMKAFKREQRFARRLYRKELGENFDESIQAGQDRQDADYYPSATEVEEEAWENYEFDGLMIFDGDQAEQLVVFRSSLFVIPPSPWWIGPCPDATP
jgi:hypothetical protein